MIFSSLEFLLLFPLFWLVYWSLPGRFRLSVLFIASLSFYAYGEPAGVPLLVVVIVVAYLAGVATRAWPRYKTPIVAFGVTALLAILGYFKYGAFLASICPWPIDLPVASFLPLGISFFIFECIACLVDVKRGTAPVEWSPLRLGLFAAVFPHLISGPIMRPNEFLPQLQRRLERRLTTFGSGLQLFTEGFLKKRLLADPAGLIADRAFAAPYSEGTLAAWVAVLAYTVQIYGDFAGYTDMARGLARMLGLELPLNFDVPYAAISITDFWRRWHISLSSWLRDYLYVPLGGNRRGGLRTVVNLITTMLLAGLWHGAGWTFIAWGAYHGVLLAIERRFSWTKRVPNWVAIPMTLFLVVNGWVLFRSQSFPTYLEVLRALYVPRGGVAAPGRDILVVAATFPLVLGAMIARRFFPDTIEWLRRFRTLTGAAYGTALGIALLLAPTTSRAFIYFRF